ncbi:hypothetical protein HOLleu_36387 [Holothuria leucospilota]|uniref:Uncharacterized protein n=1 Tax=Holothuria leucospilota TaxID=206669 RepID=A0A9Q0YRA0_HOLLE|nr:hypothetical protein HOLleu_36387 [Holothuria leucospilota]
MHHPQHTYPTDTLWGAKARSVTASFQIVLGVLEVMLGITVIVLPLGYLDVVDYIGWGIWCGALITYMVLSIIAAVMCGLCLYPQIVLAIEIKLVENDWYRYFDETYTRSHFISYVTLAVSLLLQGIASIIGASFTCGALCNSQAGDDRPLMQTETQLNNIYHPQHTSPTGTLWGAKARSVSASFQIVLGVLEVMLGITVIVLPLGYSDTTDYIGWGIWCGAVITYMVLSIIAAVMCVLCLFPQIGLAIMIKLVEKNDWYWVFDETNTRSHFILYVTLAVSLLLQGIASIIGASCTCGALCNFQAGDDRPLMYYQLREPTQQTVGSVPPPYTVVTTGQPSQCLSNPNVQQSMSEMTKHPS